MWATTTTLLPTPPITSFPATFSRRRAHQISATSNDDSVSGLGQAVLTTLGPQTPQAQQGKPKVKPKKREEKGNEISGSDILRALQKASARKAQISTNKKKQQQLNRSLNKRENVNVNANANRIVDYDKVRPLNVKSDWATRLDDLQKRLQEFSSF